MPNKHDEYITIEDDRVFLWQGHPQYKYSNKIDVTMAFKIGLHIGAKEYEKIELLQLKI